MRLSFRFLGRILPIAAMILPPDAIIVPLFGENIADCSDDIAVGCDYRSAFWGENCRL